MKKQNDKISANEKDTRNSQKQNNNESSRKRDEPEDKGEVDHENVQSNANKKARVSVASLQPEPEPEPGLGQVVELPASFDTLDDDCLGNVLDFVGKKSYSAFGRVNKRCHEMFCSKGLSKETYLFGYAPLRIIQQKEEEEGGMYYADKLSKGVLHFNRRDILEWLLTNESIYNDYNLMRLCYVAIKESRLDILRQVFQRGTEWQLEILRDCGRGFDLCAIAAEYGKLECLKFLRQNECGWNRWTWFQAKDSGHEHILEYLRDNGYPTEWR